MLTVVPGARIGHIGLYRDRRRRWWWSLLQDARRPRRTRRRRHRPLLATGHSAVAAVDRLKGVLPRSIKFVCLVASPEGLKILTEAHPDVTIYTAAVDRELDADGCILPGIGDAADRVFGTD